VRLYPVGLIATLALAILSEAIFIRILGDPAMKRCAFGLILTLALFGAPFIAVAQAVKPVIGILTGGSRGGQGDAAFKEGLSDTGYVEGRNLAIEYREAEGQYDRLPALAADLVSRQVALIATVTLPGALAAKAATTTIPIVFVVGEDPVQAGLVASLSRPGGNVTGLSSFTNVLVAKRLELIRELAPAGAALGWLVNPNNPNAEPDTRAVQAASDALRQKLVVVKAGNDRELEAAFATLVREQVGGLGVNIDPFFIRRRAEIIALAARHRLPAIYMSADFATVGGLMSYGANIADLWRQAGVYAGRILKGEKPADLPVQQPTRFALVINLKTAKALGITMPPSLLVLADEVIQ
jgi:putative tryptophan/tyrosine transport system substrate-binding protein